MWEAYLQTVQVNPFDWFILSFGFALIAAHLFGLRRRSDGKLVKYVQGLDRYRTVCLLFTELLPVLGLLGTVLSLMFTFKNFQVATQGDAPNLSQMVNDFAPAMSTTISGLLMVIPNLALNSIMWLACPSAEKRQDEP